MRGGISEEPGGRNPVCGGPVESGAVLRTQKVLAAAVGLGKGLCEQLLRYFQTLAGLEVAV